MLPIAGESRAVKPGAAYEATDPGAVDRTLTRDVKAVAAWNASDPRGVPRSTFGHVSGAPSLSADQVKTLLGELKRRESP